MAAILAIMGQTGFDHKPDFVLVLVLALFGLVLSVLGFGVVITLTLGHLHHITDIVMIFYYWDKMEFYKHPKKPIHFFKIHRWFYEITIALFATLSLFCGYMVLASPELSHEHWIVPILIFITILVHIEILYKYKWEKYSDECWYFEMALKNDTEGIYRRDWDKWFKDPDFRRKIVVDAENRGKKKVN